MSRAFSTPLMRWIDSYAAADPAADADETIDWLRVLPFIVLHVSCLAVIWVGFSWTALWIALASYSIRMFGITAAYHRYFSHRSFKTSRAMQFILAVLGNASTQRGPLWWAAHHRHHHRSAETSTDIHSPVERGFWWSHLGWFLARGSFRTRLERISDYAKFPELKFLDRFDWVVPVLFALALYALGELLATYQPALGTDGWQILVWGFSIATIALFHVTFCINSLAHIFGKRRYETKDNSRNNFVLAVLTFGEGWHNNHHFFAGSARQGFFWWEIDFTWYLLKMLSWMGLVWDLRLAPAHIVAGRPCQPLIVAQSETAG